jgi:hypothetical protein
VQYDFSRIDDIDSFISIPEGRYTCRIGEVREGVSRDGSPRWSLRLEVALGEYAGRTAAWDSVTWSERGIRRVKHVLEALGLDVSGQVEIAPNDLLGREVVASFQSEEREDAFTGRRVLRLRVPYAGYSASPDGALRSHGGGDGSSNGDSSGSGDGAASNGVDGRGAAHLSAPRGTVWGRGPLGQGPLGQGQSGHAPSVHGPSGRDPSGRGAPGREPSGRGASGGGSSGRIASASGSGNGFDDEFED